MYFDLVSRCLFLLLETVLAFLLVHRRVWREFPIFSLYVVFLLVSDILVDGIFLLAKFNSSFYGYFYLIDAVIDWIAVFLVLIEIGASVIDRAVSFRLEKLRWIVAGGLGLLTLLTWPIARYSLLTNESREVSLVSQIQMVMALVSLVSLLTYASIVYLLSIGWSGLAWKIGVGLGAYDVIHITITVLGTRGQLTNILEPLIYPVESVTYFSILLYWIICMNRYREIGSRSSSSLQG